MRCTATTARKRPPSTRRLATLCALTLAIVAIEYSAWGSRPTVKQAHALLQRGRYEDAEQAFRALIQHDGGSSARLGLAAVLLQTGRYPEAGRVAKQAARGAAWAAALTLVAESQRLAGNVSAAELLLRRVVRRAPRHSRARVMLGLVYRDQGKAALARSTFHALYDDHDTGRIDEKSAEQLTYLGMACRYTDNFEDADLLFRRASALDADRIETWVERAEISLEKYDVPHAAKQFATALAQNPHYPRALVGLARVKLEQSHDVAGALRLVRRALQTDPLFVPAHILEARALIADERHTEARRLLKQARKRNPNHPAILSMLAASYFLSGDRKQYEAHKSRVLAGNPRYTALFRTIARLAAEHHRYEEAVALGIAAIAIDPHDWYALADLGTNYLRLGDDKNGLKYLTRAWQGDQYNVRTRNLLELYERVLFRDYTFVSSKHFRLRVHKAEAALLAHAVIPVLERAYAHYARRYEFRPRAPVIVELYRNPAHYAIRTVGLPTLAVQGVCFGRVITSTSPLRGAFNWGQVLWHELNHVFTIQLSRSRIPRWLSEGLADMELAAVKPVWRRKGDLRMYLALNSGRLLGLDSMNRAFTRAQSLDAIRLAYSHSALLAGYLVEHWGRKHMVKALKQYADGKTTAEILPASTGLPLAELDRRFRASQRARLANYRTGWLVDELRYQHLESFERRARHEPNDTALLGQLAVAQLVNDRAADAAATARRALRYHRDNRLALYVRARVALSMEPREQAAKHLRRLISAGGDGYFSRLELGTLALARGDTTAAVQQLNRAKSFDREQARPYALLADSYERQGKTDQAIRELKGLVQLQQQRLAPTIKLVQLLARRADHAGVREYGELAYYIQPASAQLHVLLAKAYEAPAPRPDLKRAIWHLKTALLCRPDNAAKLRRELARLSKKAGQPTRNRSPTTTTRSVKSVGSP